jgi:hypothetical protein
MIKKLIFLISLLLINPAFSDQRLAALRGKYQLPMKRSDRSSSRSLADLGNSIVVEETGFYWVILKHMPSLWTFWRCWKPVRIMAQYAKTSTHDIWRTIDSEMPVLMTTNLEEAQKLKIELLALGCEIEIHEVAFSFASNEDAEYFKNRLSEKV